MAVAATKIRVYAKATSSSVISSDLIAGINDQTYEEMSTMLDTTSFKTLATDVWKRRIAGLFDGKIDLAGDFEAADAPQILLRTSRTTGADVYITVLFDSSAAGGSQGFKVACQVESMSVKGSTDGKTEFSCSLVFNGAPTAV